MSLRAKAVSGGSWLAFSSATTACIAFCQTAALSRLLSPKDFGLMAMIWTVLGFAQTFSDMGVSNAVIYRQDATREQLSSVYWLSGASALAVAAAAMLSAPLLVLFYHEPALSGLLPWVAATFPVAAAGHQFQVLAQRNLHFNRLAILEITAALTGSVSSISLAYWGFGAYSLVFGGLLASASKAFLLILTGWREWHPSLRFRRTDLRGFLRFGAYQMGERTANYVWSNVDYLAVGRFLGADALGIYRLAYEVVVRPLGTINPILNTIAYPIFARKQNDDATLRRGFLEMIRIVSTLTAPLLAGLAAVAPLAVDVIFGRKWAAAAAVIQVLAVLGLLRSLLNPVGALVLAKGRVDIGFRWNLVLAAANTLVFWVVAPSGLIPLAWAAVAILLCVVLLSWKNYHADTIGLRPSEYCRAFLRPLLLSLAMAAAVHALGLWLAGFALASWQRLALLVAAGGVLYGGLFALLDRSYLQELRRSLRPPSS